MLGTSIDNTSITMSPSPAGTTTVFRDDCTVLITPDSNLSANTSYTVTVTTNVKSLFWMATTISTVSVFVYNCAIIGRNEIKSYRTELK